MKVDTPNEIHLVLALWGEEYIYDFFDRNLFSRLNKNNLPYFSNSLNVVYKIYSDKEGIALIKKQTHFNYLANTITLKLVEIDLSVAINFHERMNMIHAQSIRDSYSSSAALFFDSPDVIFAENFFRNIVPLIQKGKRCILIPSFRLDRTAVYEDEVFQKSVKKREGVSEKQLISLGLKYMHPYLTKTLFIYGNNGLPIQNWFSHLYWKIDDNNVFIHGYHFHPFYIWPVKQTDPHLESIDGGGYIAETCGGNKNIYISKKNDGFVFFELTKVDHSLGKTLNKSNVNVLLISIWSYQFAHPMQKKNIYKIKFFFATKTKIPFVPWMRLKVFLSALFILDLIPIRLRLYACPTLRKSHRCVNSYYENKILRQFDLLETGRVIDTLISYEPKIRRDFLGKFLNKIQFSQLTDTDQVKLLAFLKRKRKIAESLYFEIQVNGYDFVTSKIKSRSVYYSLLKKSLRDRNRLVVENLFKDERLLKSLSKRQLLRVYQVCYASTDPEFRDSMIHFFLRSDIFLKKVGLDNLVGYLPCQKRYYDYIRPKIKSKLARYVLLKKSSELGDRSLVESLLKDEGLVNSLSKRQLLRVYQVCYASTDSEFRDSMVHFFLRSDTFLKKVGLDNLVGYLPRQKRYYDYIRPKIKSKLARYLLLKKSSELGDRSLVEGLLKDEELVNSLSKRQLLRVYQICYASTDSEFRDSMVSFFPRLDAFVKRVGLNEVR